MEILWENSLGVFAVCGFCWSLVRVGQWSRISLPPLLCQDRQWSRNSLPLLCLGSPSSNAKDKIHYHFIDYLIMKKVNSTEE